jgi:hypothetical protein
LGAIGILKETEEGDLGVEFIIGPRAFLELWEIGFLIRLRPEDILHEGGDGLGIEPNFGISAELNKFHCRCGDRAGTIRERKGQGWLILK